MGNTSGKRRKQVKEEREAQKAGLFMRAEQVLAAKAHDARSAATGALMPFSENAFSANIAAAKHAQLQRRGAQLSKADYIAILLKLQRVPETELAMHRYNSMSCDDLRSALRLLLYASDVVADAAEEEAVQRQPIVTAEVVEYVDASAE